MLDENPRGESIINVTFLLVQNPTKWYKMIYWFNLVNDVVMIIAILGGVNYYSELPK